MQTQLSCNIHATRMQRTAADAVDLIRVRGFWLDEDTDCEGDIARTADFADRFPLPFGAVARFAASGCGLDGLGWAFLSRDAACVPGLVATLAAFFTAIHAAVEREECWFAASLAEYFCPDAVGEKKKRRCSQMQRHDGS